VDRPAAVKARLEAFGAEVLSEAMNRPVQVANGGLYLRGLIGQGQRKSLEPLVERLGGEADYQSLQQFLADSPWDPARVVRAVAERVAPAIEVEAWVLDDTGFPKDGKRSPGVKRQYSGTLGKIGNCQIGVSLHAVGARGTVPLGWALYLPEDWCADSERRREAKIPAEIEFKTKPELGVELVERAAGWAVPAAPVLGDCAYGDNTELRERLDGAGREYALSVSAETSVFAPQTTFAVPPRSGKAGRPRSRLRPDRKPEPIGALIAALDSDDWQTVTFRDRPDGEPMASRYAFVRVRAAHRWQKATRPPPPRVENHRHEEPFAAPATNPTPELTKHY
jgi:SRSO17 transposase